MCASPSVQSLRVPKNCSALTRQRQPDKVLERFKQEEALFNFFVNGHSVIDCFFFGLYWIGSAVEPTIFPALPEAEHRKIDPDFVTKKFKRSAHWAVFATAFDALQHSSEYKEWKAIRNILDHRATYGRQVIHQPDMSVLHSAWMVRGLPINDQLTRTRRTWLAAILCRLLEGAASYADTALPAPGSVTTH
jgi:hypothetical protein